MNTTRLVGVVEMNARFANLVSPSIIEAEPAFYNTLLRLAGKEVGAPTLVFVMTMALVKHSQLLPVNVSKHLRAMVGDDPNNAVLKEAEALFTRVGEKAKRPR